MKKTLISILLLILIGGVSFLFFNKKEDLNTQNSLPVYFSKSIENSNQIFAVRRSLKEGIDNLTLSLEYLLTGPTFTEKRNGYFTEIPKNTKIIELTNNEESITINITKDFEIGGGANSMTIRLKQLTYTILDNAPNKPIYLKINGKKVKTLGGEGVEVPQPLNKNINKSLDI